MAKALLARSVKSDQNRNLSYTWTMTCPSPLPNPHPFTEEADLVRLLHTLPESLLLVTMEDRVAAGDLPWLVRMEKAGFFDAHLLMDAAGAEPKNAQMLYNHWAARCKAMLGVMGQACLSHPDPKVMAGYEKSHSCFRAQFSMPKENKDFFAGFCQTIGEQALVWQKLPIKLLPIETLMAQTMGLAAMLDRPEVLKRLAQSFPVAVNQVFDEQALGNGMFSKVCDKPIRMEVGPLFCALQFSSPDCVAALLPWSSKDAGLFIARVGEDEELETIKTLASFKSMCHRGQVESMTLLIRSMVEQTKGDAFDQRDLKTVFRRLMPDTDPNTRMLPAFVDAGVADFDPTDSVVAAVKFNKPYVIDHFRDRIDWDSFVTMPTASSQAFINAIDKNKTKGLSSLIAQAKDSGHGKDFLNTFVLAADGSVMRAVAKPLLTSKAGVAVLPHVLDLGLSADALTNDGVTLKAFAAMHPWGAVDILNSFSARAKARAVITEIEDSEFAFASPPTKNNALTP